MNTSKMLRPMPPDALAPRPDARAVYEVREAPLEPASEKPSCSPLMHVPVLADAPVREPAPEKAVLPPEPAFEEAQEAALPADENWLAGLDELLSSFSAEDDDDDDEPDAMPTEEMPVPVSVPLFEMETPRRWRRKK